MQISRRRWLGTVASLCISACAVPAIAKPTMTLIHADGRREGFYGNRLDGFRGRGIEIHTNEGEFFVTNCRFKPVGPMCALDCGELTGIRLTVAHCHFDASLLTAGGSGMRYVLTC